MKCLFGGRRKLREIMSKINSITIKIWENFSLSRKSGNETFRKMKQNFHLKFSRQSWFDHIGVSILSINHERRYSWLQSDFMMDLHLRGYSEKEALRNIRKCNFLFPQRQTLDTTSNVYECYHERQKTLIKITAEGKALARLFFSWTAAALENHIRCVI